MKCLICGDDFTPDKRRKARCAKDHYRDCATCGQSFYIAANMKPTATYCSYKCSAARNKKGPPKCRVCDKTIVGRSVAAKCCSKECSQILRNSTSLQKTLTCEWCGNEFTAKGNKRFCDGEHFNECVVCRSSFVVAPYAPGKACSVECRSVLINNEESHAKRRATSRQKWNTDYPLQSDEVKAKIRASNSDDSKSLVLKSDTSPQAIGELIEYRFNTKVEFEKPLGNCTIDLYIPIKDLYVDLHPTISHNMDKSFACVRNSCAEGCTKHPPIPLNYHYLRAKAAFEENRTLIQWYGWESNEVLLTLLDGKLRTFSRKYSARKLSLQFISQTTANRFLKEYHIQGGARNQSQCFGLFDGDELIAVATFGKSRFGNRAEWEFIRYAVKRGCSFMVVQRNCFKLFIEACSPSSVVSYLDFNHTTRRETFLNTLGFEESRPTGPSIVWHRVQDDRVIRQTSLLAIGADRLLGTSYGSRNTSGRTNEDIMRDHGFVAVPTAGNRVFGWSAVSES